MYLAEVVCKVVEADQLHIVHRADLLKQFDNCHNKIDCLVLPMRDGVKEEPGEFNHVEPARLSPVERLNLLELISVELKHQVWYCELVDKPDTVTVPVTQQAVDDFIRGTVV